MRQKCFNSSCQLSLLSKTSIKIFQWSCKGIVMLHRGFCASDYLFQMHISLFLDEMTPHQYEISIAEANHKREILTKKLIFLKKTKNIWITAPTRKRITFLHSSSLRIENFPRKQILINILVDMLQVTLSKNVWFTSLTDLVSGQKAVL